MSADNEFPHAGAGCDEQILPAADQPPPSGQGHLAGPHEQPPDPSHASSKANVVALPYPETCPGCAETRDPCPVCPRHHAIQGNLDLARDEGRCPTFPVGCNLDPAWAETDEGGAVCRACIGDAA